ncbi:SWIM zinc finger family protein [Rubritalea tangerina]|uniref:SWIM zinc finger family protein n=1 Tax=Rubritalea tangerina TaxID=430798 RepID=UPI003609F254
MKKSHVTLHTNHNDPPNIFYFQYSVKGSRRNTYQTGIIFNDIELLDINCQCADYEYCKHAAAALFLLESQLSALTQGTPSSHDAIRHWIENSITTSLNNHNPPVAIQMMHLTQIIKTASFTSYPITTTP